MLCILYNMFTHQLESIYQDHALKENWVSISQHLSLGGSSLSGSEIGFYTHSSNLWFCLTWAYTCISYVIKVALHLAWTYA